MLRLAAWSHLVTSEQRYVPIHPPPSLLPTCQIPTSAPGPVLTWCCQHTRMDESLKCKASRLTSPLHLPPALHLVLGAVTGGGTSKAFKYDRARLPQTGSPQKKWSGKHKDGILMRPRRSNALRPTEMHQAIKNLSKPSLGFGKDD